MSGGGLATLRAAMLSRIKRLHIGFFARELGVGVGALEAFATGSATLPEPTLQKLVREIFGANAHLDVEADLLERRTPEPRPAGIIASSPTERMTLPKFKPGPAAPAPGLATTPPPPLRKPGWK